MCLNKKYLLKDLCDFNDDSYSLDDKWEFINYLDTGNITENKIDKIKHFNLFKDKVPSRAKRKVNYNDIIFSTVRPIQKHYGIIKDEIENFLVSTGFTTISPNPNKVISEFIYYYLTQENIIKYLDNIAEQSTSTYPSIKPSDLENLEINLPSINKQKATVRILKKLESLIKINNSINQNLEHIMNNIFKNWFIDLNYFNNEKIIETEYGKMLENWRIMELKDFSQDIICGKTPSTKKPEYYGENIPFITIPDMHNQIFILETERYLSNEGSNSQIKKLLPENSVCVSCIATVGLVSLINEKSHTNQQINSIICDNKDYYFLYLKMLTLSKYIESISSGSTTFNLNKEQFSKIKIIVPPKKIINNFNIIIEPIFNKIKQIQHENLKLTKLRDILLPKLMSGEIDVSNVEI
ncbi:MAG: restriction endonuclease subunit S [Methanobacteriaceae archaeon]|jgi:type I restriction enzyme S subunit|nr:restriction endonuclease subunit S [Methanobacteriaceae archaeon]